MKKIATFVGAAALLAATFVPALAAGNNCGNGTTGPGSNNTCSIANTSSVTVNNVNDAQINNRVTTSTNTGGNSASNNTLGGTVVSGNASSNNTVSTVANVSTTNVTVGFGGGAGNNGSNLVTGPFSNTNAFITNSARVGVQNDNTASVNNDVNTSADTGNNRANNNTGPAIVRSGNAMLNTVVGTHANDALTEVAVNGAGEGGNTVGNGTTGPFSNTMASVNNSANVTVNNINDLIVNNDVAVRGRTGNNSASNNTLGGDVTSGNATVGAGVNVEGNISTTGISVAMGGFGNDASNNVTGPNSNTGAYVTNAQSAVVNNINNKCQSRDRDRLECRDPEGSNLGVFNDVSTTTDAGNSKADNNTGPGNVMAGWASLVQQVLVHLNDPFTQLNLL